jgi:hypothetical protein
LPIKACAAWGSARAAGWGLLTDLQGLQDGDLGQLQLAAAEGRHHLLRIVEVDRGQGQPLLLG